MALYHVNAAGSLDGPNGVYPDLPETEQGVSWAGVYDPDSHTYVIRTMDQEIEGLEPLAAGTDVGYDYSSLTTQA